MITIKSIGTFFSSFFPQQRTKSWDNEEIMKILCGQNGYALLLASKRLRDNEEIVKTACGQKGDALEYASERLRDNEEIVRIAAGQSRRALQFASTRLRTLLGDTK